MRHRARWVALLAATVMVAVPTAAFALVWQTGDILAATGNSIYNFGPTLTPSATGTMAIDMGAVAYDLAISPDARYLAAANSDTWNLRVYDHSGALLYAGPSRTTQGQRIHDVEFGTISGTDAGGKPVTYDAIYAMRDTPNTTTSTTVEVFRFDPAQAVAANRVVSLGSFTATGIYQGPGSNDQGGMAYDLATGRVGVMGAVSGAYSGADGSIAEFQATLSNGTLSAANTLAAFQPYAVGAAATDKAPNISGAIDAGDGFYYAASFRTNSDGVSIVRNKWGTDGADDPSEDDRANCRDVGGTGDADQIAIDISVLTNGSPITASSNATPGLRVWDAGSVGSDAATPAIANTTPNASARAVEVVQYPRPAWKRGDILVGHSNGSIYNFGKSIEADEGGVLTIDAGIAAWDMDMTRNADYLAIASGADVRIFDQSGALIHSNTANINTLTFGRISGTNASGNPVSAQALFGNRVPTDGSQPLDVEVFIFDPGNPVAGQRLVSLGTISATGIHCATASADQSALAYDFSTDSLGVFGAKASGGSGTDARIAEFSIALNNGVLTAANTLAAFQPTGVGGEILPNIFGAVDAGDGTYVAVTLRTNGDGNAIYTNAWGTGDADDPTEDERANCRDVGQTSDLDLMFFDAAVLPSGDVLTVSYRTGTPSPFGLRLWDTSSVGADPATPLLITQDPTARGTSIQFAHVPEPATLALLGAGLLAVARRRRRQ